MFSPSCAFAGSRPAFTLQLPPFRLFQLFSYHTIWRLRIAPSPQPLGVAGSWRRGLPSTNIRAAIMARPGPTHACIPKEHRLEQRARSREPRGDRHRQRPQYRTRHRARARAGGRGRGGHHVAVDGSRRQRRRGDPRERRARAGEARRCARARAGRRAGRSRGRGVRGARHPGQQCRGAPRNRSGDRDLRGLSGAWSRSSWTAPS